MQDPIREVFSSVEEAGALLRQMGDEHAADAVEKIAKLDWADVTAKHIADTTGPETTEEEIQNRIREKTKQAFVDKLGLDEERANLLMDNVTISYAYDPELDTKSNVEQALKGALERGCIELLGKMNSDPALKHTATIGYLLSNAQVQFGGQTEQQLRQAAPVGLKDLLSESGPVKLDEQTHQRVKQAAPDEPRNE